MNSIAFIKVAPLDQFGPAGQALADAARQAFVSGVSAAVLITSGVLLAGAVLVGWWGRPHPNARHPAA